MIAVQHVRTADPSSLPPAVHTVTDLHGPIAAPHLQPGFIRRLQDSVLDNWLAPAREQQVLALTSGVPAGLEQLEKTGCVVSGVDLPRSLRRVVHLPFAGAMFHQVVSLAAFEHSKDPDAFLQELRRVTRLGGHLLLSVPSLSYRESAPEVRRLYRDTYGSRDSHTRLTLERRLEQAGFLLADSIYVCNSPLSHRLFTWALRRECRGRLYSAVSPVAYGLCSLSDRLWGRPTEGHFLIVRATAV
jgi:SAM-dependent methyltransferase